MSEDTHAPCTDAECNICRGDIHVIGPNPDDHVNESFDRVGWTDDLNA